MKWLDLKKILWIIIFLLFPVLASGSPALPAGNWEYEFVYDRLEKMEALAFDVYEWQLGPYGKDIDQFDWGPFEWLKHIDSSQLRVFGTAAEDFRTARKAAASGYESFRGGFAAQPVKKLFVYANFVLDERKAEDPMYLGKKWRGLAGGVENAFASFRSGQFELLAGRFASFWGPRHSLVLSSRAAMDGIAYSFRWGRLCLSYRLARLDGLNPDRDHVDEFENRYFAGHRLDWHVSPRIRVGVFETVVFGGPGRQIDLYYLNPIIFFHSSQLNEGMDDNTFLGFDLTVKPKTGCKLYGQLLVDDFQIDKRSQGDEEPSEIGLLLGAYLADIAPSWDIRAEYTRVTNWTFNQVYDRNRYLYENELIGAARGNDYDQTLLSAVKWLSPDLALSLNLSYFRQGEGRVTADWTAPWLDTTGHYEQPFPTGTVWKTATVSLGAKGFFFDHFFVDFEAGLDSHHNFDNVAGVRRTSPYVNLKVSAFFNTAVDVR